MSTPPTISFDPPERKLAHIQIAVLERSVDDITAAIIETANMLRDRDPETYATLTETAAIEGATLAETLLGILLAKTVKDMLAETEEEE